MAGDGEGADVVIEAAGTVEAWERAISLVRPGGTVLAFGGLPREARVAVDPYRIHYEEVRLVGAFHHTPRHVRAALGLPRERRRAVRAADQPPRHARGCRRAPGRPAGGLPQGGGSAVRVATESLRRQRGRRTATRSAHRRPALVPEASSRRETGRRRAALSDMDRVPARRLGRRIATVTPTTSSDDLIVSSKPRRLA